MKQCPNPLDSKRDAVVPYDAAQGVLGWTCLHVVGLAAPEMADSSRGQLASARHWPSRG
jgi:hypothetical protein